MALVLANLANELASMPRGTDPQAAADAWLNAYRDYARLATANGVPATPGTVDGAAEVIRPQVRASFAAQLGIEALERTVMWLWDPAHSLLAPNLYFTGATALDVLADGPQTIAQLLGTTFAANRAAGLGQAAAMAAIAADIHNWVTLVANVAVTFAGPTVVPLA